VKLEEAIEIGTEMSEPGIVAYDKRDLDALKLLVNAGKRIERLRRKIPELAEDLLPGETEE